ncbi:unnamed protein product [marine sediment metagenome]|uniref:Uncharacterized protein n=1 Tax=marine sediment metagenome TaxID=412755 RepID=X0WQK3_9ZZZZ
MVDTFYCETRKALVPKDELYCKYACELVTNPNCPKTFKYENMDLT